MDDVAWMTPPIPSYILALSPVKLTFHTYRVWKSDALITPPALYAELLVN